MKTLRNLTLSAAFLALTAMPAKADFGPDTYCGGSLFETCASINLTSAFNGTNTVISVTISNQSLQGDVFKSIGIVNVPAGWTMVDNDINSDDWSTPASGLSGDGITPVVYGFEADAPPTTYGLSNGDEVTFWFAFSGEVDASQVRVAVHSISGPNGCSTKLVVGAAGPLDNYNAEEAEAQGCTTTVPEPASMFLFGAGMVGFLATRRRRNALEG